MGSRPASAAAPWLTRSPRLELPATPPPHEPARNWAVHRSHRRGPAPVVAAGGQAHRFAVSRARLLLKPVWPRQHDCFAAPGSTDFVCLDKTAMCSWEECATASKSAPAPKSRNSLRQSHRPRAANPAERSLRPGWRAFPTRLPAAGRSRGSHTAPTRTTSLGIGG